MVYSLFCSWKGSVQIYKEKVTATCIWFWCIRKISQNVNKKFVLTWFRTVGSATSWRNKQCTIERVFSHLVPDGWLCHNPLLGPLKFPPAVALPLLAQLSPRVGGLLEKEQEAAAREVENQS